MEYISIVCPNCGKELKVPADAEKIVCMFCAYPIEVKSLIGPDLHTLKKDEDITKLLFNAKQALPDEIFTSRIELNKMNAKIYPEIFENYAKLLQPFWQPFNGAAEIDEPAAVDKISDFLLDGFSKQVKSEAGGNAATRFFDYRFTITSLFVPAVLEQKAPAAEKLADCFLEKWNAHYPKRRLGKATFQTIESGFKKKFCFITTATCTALKKGDNCTELNEFRKFRDGWLCRTALGQKKITEYYLFAPIIVDAIYRFEKPEKEYKRIWEKYLVPCLCLIKGGKNSECAQKYEAMMIDLEKKWL